MYRHFGIIVIIFYACWYILGMISSRLLAKYIDKKEITRRDIFIDGFGGLFLFFYLLYEVTVKLNSKFKKTYIGEKYKKWLDESI
jgi:hypothetical protein